MDSEGLEVFLTAVRKGSLSAAAKHLKLTPMSTTRRLVALEEELGVRLIHRTSRRLALTPEGEAFLPFAAELVNTQEAARAALSPEEGGATGLLRVTAPVTLGRKRILPIIPGLLEENPRLRIELDLNDAMVDIVASGVDLAIRIAPLKDSGLIARRLVDNPKLIYAAPAYLERHAAPRTIDDLEHHECLTWTNFTTGSSCRRQGPVGSGERPVLLEQRRRLLVGLRRGARLGATLRLGRPGRGREREACFRADRRRVAAGPCDLGRVPVAAAGPSQAPDFPEQVPEKLGLRRP